MDTALKTRLILALKHAAGTARSSEAQTEANELASVLEAMPVDETAPAVPQAAVGFGPQDDVAGLVSPSELRKSVQASTEEAESKAYEKVYTGSKKSKD